MWEALESEILSVNVTDDEFFSESGTKFERKENGAISITNLPNPFQQGKDDANREGNLNGKDLLETFIFMAGMKIKFHVESPTKPIACLEFVLEEVNKNEGTVVVYDVSFDVQITLESKEDFTDEVAKSLESAFASTLGVDPSMVKAKLVEVASSRRRLGRNLASAFDVKMTVTGMKTLEDVDEIKDKVSQTAADPAVLNQWLQSSGASVPVALSHSSLNMNVGVSEKQVDLEFEDSVGTMQCSFALTLIALISAYILH
jgi:hypothetical protein